MAKITLRLVGDLNQDKRLVNIDMNASDERYRPKVIELKDGQKETKIGRLNSTNPPNYLLESCINKRMISRNHATIELLPHGGYMLYDHSMNGTYVNYMRVSGGVTLKHGDIVCFGHLNGANLKPGESVPPFFSDLKYKVHIGSSMEVAAAGVKDSPADRASPHKRQRQMSGRGVKSPSRTSKGKRDGSSRASDLRRSEEQGFSDKSMAKESDEDLIDHLSKQKSTPIATAGLNVKKQQSSSSRGNTAKSILSSSLQKRLKPSKKRRMKGPGSPSSTAGESVTHTTEEDQEECSARVCKKPAGTAIDWIQCDSCSKWYHQACLALTAEEADAEVYYCPGCNKRR